jgi:formylglycine-generating enzyme required for sulfatase activity
MAESCCASSIVPGGTFARGDDVSGDGMYTDGSNVATLGDFRIDTYEVTVGRFRQFVAAGMGTQASPPTAGSGAHAKIAGSGWAASWDASLAATMIA